MFNLVEAGGLAGPWSAAVVDRLQPSAAANTWKHPSNAQTPERLDAWEEDRDHGKDRTQGKQHDSSVRNS